MKPPAFCSSLARTMIDLVTAKRMEGFDYTAQAKLLGYFDAFLCKQGYRETVLDRGIIDAYIARTATLAVNCRYSRLSIVRVLSRYLHQFDPQNYVLRELPVSRPALPRWYLYSPEDIAALMQYAKTLAPTGALHSHCFQALVGLLSVTGLRIGEALALNLGDLDTSRRLLFVRKGKFGKSRYVVLHPTTIEALEDYLGKRTVHWSAGDGSPFFLSSSGGRLGYRQVARTFRRAVRRCGVGQDAPQLPRLHDLRHTFAFNCLLKWYEEGADVNSKLPILATAMGHVNVNATQVYLHVTPRLLDKVAQLFQTTFSASCRARGE